MCVLSSYNRRFVLDGLAVKYDRKLAPQAESLVVLVLVLFSETSFKSVRFLELKLHVKAICQPVPWIIKRHCQEIDK